MRQTAPRKGRGTLDVPIETVMELAPRHRDFGIGSGMTEPGTGTILGAAVTDRAAIGMETGNVGRGRVVRASIRDRSS